MIFRGVFQNSTNVVTQPTVCLKSQIYHPNTLISRPGRDGWTGGLTKYEDDSEGSFKITLTCVGRSNSLSNPKTDFHQENLTQKLLISLLQQVILYIFETRTSIFETFSNTSLAFCKLNICERSSLNLKKEKTPRKDSYWTSQPIYGRVNSIFSK